MCKFMTPDNELLRQYSVNGDESAFAEVVRRQINWVYAAALRVANGNTALAEDACQAVFTDLARKAGLLSRHAALAGWLHTSARYAVLKAIRGEQRRQIREQEAAMLNSLETSTVDWDNLRPVLDEAVGHLREGERAVVVLRYFQGLSHREVGEALGLNENTVRKRADRALEKLRAYFAGAGVTISPALLASTLTARSQIAAPAGLAEKIAKSSGFRMAGGGSLMAFLSRILFMSTKTKIVLGVTVIIVAAALFSTWINFREQSASSADKPITAAPAASKPSTPTEPPKVMMEPPVAAPAEAGNSTQQGIAAAPAVNTDLNSAVDDMIAKIEANDIDGFVDTYLAPGMADSVMFTAMLRIEKRSKIPPEQMDQVRAQMQQIVQQQISPMIQQIKQRLTTNPGSMQEWQMLANAVKAVKNNPQMNAAGDKATYVLNTNGNKDMPAQVVMRRTNGKWVFDEVGLALPGGLPGEN